MPSDKEIKKEFKKKASQNPDKYYATSVLKQEGFMRKQCKCGTFFWTTNAEQKTCGDPSCSGGFRFFDKNPAKKKLDYIEVWEEFAKLHKKLGYTPIKRYPVVARWRDDTDFVQAGIYDFQPYVVSGEVEPPANPVVEPQFCLRFNDIDNVGITGAHYTGFDMIGQHAFMPKNKFDQQKYFSDIHTWLKKGLGLPNNEITFHEDAWAGGGNFGPCMEFFSRGLELGNQVYMLFEQTPSGYRELNLKVLDMGMGHERNAWFTKGTSTSYETTFPTVMKHMYHATGIKVDNALIKKFLPYSSYLNIDEVDDIDKAWKNVAKNIGADVKELREKIMPLAAMYSVAEHSRALLVALSDGALPSNVGGFYNLRVILRRALGFIDQYGWNVDIPTICKWHADYLKPLYPELSENLDEVSKILDVEKKKYTATKQKTKEIVTSIISKKIDNHLLMQLYDSQGIAPELIKEEAKKQGKEINVPENFYSLITEMQEKRAKKEEAVKEEKLPLEGIPETKALYYDDYSVVNFKAKVIKVIEKNVVLDSTYFYPTSGGQLHDTGNIAGFKVVDIFKQGNIIVHALAEHPHLKEGDIVKCAIDLNRRKQLAQHHTATHIVNAAARRVLGKHINQAGAKKTEEKAHLDITHYQSLTEDEIKKIEEIANKIIEEDIKVNSMFLPRNDAEKQYGMSIYQGGAVPGKIIRIIEIPEVDVEACGGTHLKHTSEVERIKILSSNKIQDGVVRLTFTAGNAAMKEEKQEHDIIKKAAELLCCNEKQVPARCKELFEKWKAVVKKNKQVESKKLSSTEEFEGDTLSEVCKILKTQPEHVLKTIKRFMDEMNK